MKLAVSGADAVAGAGFGAEYNTGYQQLMRKALTNLRAQIVYLSGESAKP